MAVAPAKEKNNAAGGKKPKDVKSLNGRQKAAIFLVSVGEEISAKIMERLREADEAIELDTTNLTIEDVINFISKKIEKVK